MDKPHPDNVALAPLVKSRPGFKPGRGIVPVRVAAVPGQKINYRRLEGDQVVFYIDAEVVKFTYGDHTGIAIDLDNCRMVNWRPLRRDDLE